MNIKTPWRNGSASDSRSEGCVFESRRGQIFFSYFSRVTRPVIILLVGSRNISPCTVWFLSLFRVNIWYLKYRIFHTFLSFAIMNKFNFFDESIFTFVNILIEITWTLIWTMKIQEFQKNRKTVQYSIHLDQWQVFRKKCGRQILTKFHTYPTNDSGLSKNDRFHR